MRIGGLSAIECRFPAQNLHETGAPATQPERAYQVPPPTNFRLDAGFAVQLETSGRCYTTPVGAVGAYQCDQCDQCDQQFFRRHPLSVVIVE
jgi:hypothetical protein